MSSEELQSDLSSIEKMDVDYDETTPTQTTTGNYKIISFTMNLKGTELSDGITYIGAYAYPDHVFSEHISFRREVVQKSVCPDRSTVFANPELDDTLTELEHLKSLIHKGTKSELVTLNVFIFWMKMMTNNLDGVILAYYENKMNSVSYLINALQRHSLMEDFFALVKGFVSSENVTSYCITQGNRPHALTNLVGKVLKTNEERYTKAELGFWDQRPRMTYQMIGDLLDVNGELSSDMLQGVIKTDRVQEEMNLRSFTQELSDRSQRRIFMRQIQNGQVIANANRARLLRNYLVKMGTGYETIRETYETTGRVGLFKSIRSKVGTAREKDIEDLVDMIGDYFKDQTLENIPSTQEVAAVEPFLPESFKDDDMRIDLLSWTKAQQTSSKSTTNILTTSVSTNN